MRQCGDEPLLWLAGGLAVGAVLAGASQALSGFVPRLSRMADALAVQLGSLSPPVTLAMALLSAVGEEWVFRGVLQPGLGWPTATLLFAVVHVPMERDLLAWPFLAGGVGLLLAWSFEVSGGLMAPIGLHFAVNALNLRWLARRSAEIARG